MEIYCFFIVSVGFSVIILNLILWITMHIVAPSIILFYIRDSRLRGILCALHDVENNVFAVYRDTIKPRITCSHWGRVTHMCVIIFIGSGNGLPLIIRHPSQCWPIFLKKKVKGFEDMNILCHENTLEKSPEKWAYCLGLNVLCVGDKARVCIGIILILLLSWLHVIQIASHHWSETSPKTTRTNSERDK